LILLIWAWEKTKRVYCTFATVGSSCVDKNSTFHFCTLCLRVWDESVTLLTAFCQLWDTYLAFLQLIS